MVQEEDHLGHRRNSCGYSERRGHWDFRPSDKPLCDGNSTIRSGNETVGSGNEAVRPGRPPQRGRLYKDGQPVRALDSGCYQHCRRRWTSGPSRKVHWRRTTESKRAPR